jgi:hypothetical protein
LQLPKLFALPVRRKKGSDRKILRRLKLVGLQLRWRKLIAGPPRKKKVSAALPLRRKMKESAKKKGSDTKCLHQLKINLVGPFGYNTRDNNQMA